MDLTAKQFGTKNFGKSIVTIINTCRMLDCVIFYNRRYGFVTFYREEDAQKVMNMVRTYREGVFTFY